MSPKVFEMEPVVECYFQLGDWIFCERFEFNDYEEYWLKSNIEDLAKTLSICAGTSYYKIAASERIEVEFEITGSQHELLKGLYDEGLREFAFQNTLPIPRKFEVQYKLAESEQKQSSVDLGNQVLPLGGGKDSAVTAMLFPQAHIFSINPSKPMFDVVKVVGKKLYSVNRKIDPQVFKLNEAGALNGHVPVTAIVSVVACIVAKILGGGDVLMSNERSASESTRQMIVEGQVLEINHQYSKSFEAEKLIFEAVKKDVGYYSVLRPLSELAIAKILSTNLELTRNILSCNNAFKVYKERKTRWCGDCPKCFFTFLILATFLTPNDLIDVFGKNLLADADNYFAFEELIDSTKKPFECVGEVNECKAAVLKLASSTEWEELELIQRLAKNIEGEFVVSEYFETSSEHNLPEQYFEIIKKALKF